MAELKVNIRSCRPFEEDEYWRLIKSVEKSGLEGLYGLVAYESTVFRWSKKHDWALEKDSNQDFFAVSRGYRNNTKKGINVKLNFFRPLSNKIKSNQNYVKKKPECTDTFQDKKAMEIETYCQFIQPIIINKINQVNV